jgi:hypothetical protein
MMIHREDYMHGRDLCSECSSTVRKWTSLKYTSVKGAIHLVGQGLMER